MRLPRIREVLANSGRLRRFARDVYVRKISELRGAERDDAEEEENSLTYIQCVEVHLTHS